jgi:2-dehydro-3-deoxygalactonokinase
MTLAPARPDWIAADWGTTRLRLWAMRGSEVLDRRSSDDGMRSQTPDSFAPALLRLAEPWLGEAPLPVVCCGMAGARGAWIEAPYARIPCAPHAAGAVSAPMPDPRLTVRILPGLSQADPPDVMRGEETQIAGFLARNPGWDGVICLPGTHSKWAHVSAGEVVSFRTFMTGELFALLSRESVLRASVAEAGWDAEAFLDAVREMLSYPERLAGALFTLRARDLLEGAAPEAARARLSGLLVGAELAASRPYWLGQQIAVVGAHQVAAPYLAALAEQGAPATEADGDAMVLAGLTSAWRAFRQTAS